jgi:serine palmitoyltransferase
VGISSSLTAVSILLSLQISSSAVRWFEYNDLRSLEDVLLSVEKERRKRRGPLTKRFIVTEGIFEKDGAMVDLPKLVSRSHGMKLAGGLTLINRSS